MLNEYRIEGGFVSERRYNSHELDLTPARFEDVNDKIERNNDDIQGKYEALDHESVNMEKRLDRIAKTVKQLYEERTNNVGFADRKIQGHIKKGLDQYSVGLGVKLDEIQE